MRVALFVTALLAIAAVAAAEEPAKEDLKPDAVAPNGAKWWKSPVKAAKANNLTAFAAALDDNGLTPDIEGADVVATVFAPTNEALRNFTSIDENVITDIVDDAAKLKQALEYHIVPGATLSVARIKELVAKAPTKTFAFKTKQGETLNATVNGAALLINGLPVAAPLDAQGGKVNFIGLNGVALPASLTPAHLPSAPISGATGAAATGLLLAVPALLALLL